MAMKVVRQARLELSGGSTPDQLRPPHPWLDAPLTPGQTPPTLGRNPPPPTPGWTPPPTAPPSFER